MKKYIFISIFSLILIGGFLSFVFFTPVKGFITYKEDGNNDESITKDKSLGPGKAKKYLEKRTYPNFHRREENPFLFNPLKNGKRPLDHFCNAIGDTIIDKKIRIAHYGDSQIEGDRISYPLRKKMQKRFGGSGVGFVPFISEGWNRHLAKYGSRNWARYTVFHKRYYKKTYGYGGTVFKYLRVVVDSLKNDTTIELTPEIMDSVRYFYFNSGELSFRFRKAPTYKEALLIYGENKNKCGLEVYNNSTYKKIFSDTLPPSDGFHMKKIPELSGLKKFKIKFTSNTSPEFYGLLLDGKTGIQVDNLAIRGHSGDRLMLIDSAFFAYQLKQLNVKLFVFQYGMNTVPHHRSEAACKRLHNWYFKLFRRFANLAPKASILVVGPGDMAAHTDDGYVTYRYMPRINEAIKNAALKAGAAYLDVYNFMGGKNSVFNWNRKGLVMLNGHFKQKGTEAIAEKIYQSLLIEYKEQQYTKTRQQRSYD